ncbi:MAG: ATP-binding cassette domain-containing protein [Owenweeksia sp.]|nr:ATP-binding cassette domain-containing protein [Owenweeksia sp.]
MEFVLETKSITKRYGSLRAVKPLNLAVPRGSIFGLLGPNGSGKTTTLGMVLGVTRASGGTYHWFGQALSFNGKQRIGAILENPNFYPLPQWSTKPDLGSYY